jgi:hypothetical protein
MINTTTTPLGGARAESDNLLDSAFVKTNDYRALVNTKDFNFVVGRRGTGKSALFIKVSEIIERNNLGYVYKNTPQEYEILEIQEIIKKITSKYTEIRSVTRVAWRLSILIDQLRQIRNHYKFKKSNQLDFLNEFMEEHESLFKLGLFSCISKIIRDSSSDGRSVGEIPSYIARHYSLERLFNAINDSLQAIGSSSYYLFDGLDEAWKPTEIATAVLGGLASCASDILEKQSEIHVVLFIRDNIFRSLSYFDGDFSRHIEGNTLRLTWDNSSLLHLVANRLRASLNLDDIENDVKVWNRFAHGELRNSNGFKACLNHTLYRPRDIIVLLNTTFIHIARADRHEIVESDINQASKQISQNRLDDLIKEYDKVFPGLNSLVSIFNTKPAFQTYSETISMIQNEIDTNNYNSIDESDYALLETGKEAFFALYSVGFIGLENPETQAVQFCHDGSSANIDASQADQRCCVHPCYWKALNIQSEILEENIVIGIYDDDRPPSIEDIRDLRTKQIGRIISSLPRMAEGKEDAKKFEEWVLQAVRLLFSGKLSNPELNPNKDSIQRRDVVATNNAATGFWKRVRDDYKSRQIVFEVKNFSNLKLDNIRQVLSYSGGHYGSFVIIVNRNKAEGLSSVERGWIKEMWSEHKIIVFILPAPFLSRCISKLRTTARFDYTEKQLEKN